MSSYDLALQKLRSNPKKWLVTGASGFIGSNIVEQLLINNQRVIGLDDFSTGHQENLDDVREKVGEEAWKNFDILELDIRHYPSCEQAVAGVDFVSHQAALGSVPRSIADPMLSNGVNVDGFVNLLWAATKAKVKRFVYAASSATYGDEPSLPKCEPKIGRPLSPYAVTKYVNELYADVFAQHYGIECIGLRYFNVFGPRQDPYGAYAAVIPRWLNTMLSGDACTIFGDGQTSRDFCFVDNAVQANILAATTESGDAINQVYNIAVGDRISLQALHSQLQQHLSDYFDHPFDIPVVFEEFRDGDVRHSQADISKAGNLLGYQPSHTAEQGLWETAVWFGEQYIANLRSSGDKSSFDALSSHKHYP